MYRAITVTVADATNKASAVNAAIETAVKQGDRIIGFEADYYMNGPAHVYAVTLLLFAPEALPTG